MLPSGRLKLTTKTFFDRIAAHDHHDRNSRGRSLGRKCRLLAATGGDQGYGPRDQIGRHCRQSIVLSVRPTIFDLNVAALDVAGIAQRFAECRKSRLPCFR
jgi:hypothetical protein